MDGKRVNITALFDACNIDVDDLEIIETDGMYPYKKKIEDNWAYYTAQGLKRLRVLLEEENKVVDRVGIVGICSGVEGIAVLRIFRNSLKKMLVTDIDSGILKGTIYNLEHALSGTHVNIVPLVGLFCEPIEEAGYTVDIVHANIPNLPTTGDEDLVKGDEKGSFAPPEYYTKYNPPDEFIHWALPAQYAYLQSAKRILNHGGSILAEIGGRMPFHILEQLFAACELDVQELTVGFKRQTEAEINFAGYYRNEKEYGVSFEYYLYEEAKKELEKHDFFNPDTRFSTNEIKEWIEPYKMSAGDALRLLKEEGVTAGHIVHLLRGAVHV